MSFKSSALFERVIPGRIVFARLSTVGHQFRGGSCTGARHYNLNFHSSQTSATFDASCGEPADHLRIDPENMHRKRDLDPRRGGVFLMIDVDSRVDNERPPNQNRDVDWPLRCMANESSPEHYNHKQKGNSGPA
jgi:hypothetical protein